MKYACLPCSELRQLLPSYIFEETSLEEMEAIGKHLSSCAACREQEVYLRTVVRAVRRRDRARARALRHRRRTQATAWGTLAIVVLALGLYWTEYRDAKLVEGDQHLAQTVAALSEQVARLVEQSDAIDEFAAAPLIAEPPKPQTSIVRNPAPPAPPMMPLDDRFAAIEEATVSLDAPGPITLLDIGEAATATAAPTPVTTPKDTAVSGDPHVDTLAPYNYSQLRALLLAGIQPESRRVQADVFMNEFSPDYRSEEETSLVVDLHAAPSPFESDALLLSVGLGHQPTQEDKPVETDYTFILADNGAGLFPRTVRNALLPWIYDKLEDSSRVSIVNAGVEGATLIDQELVRLPGGTPSAASKIDGDTPALYPSVREQLAKIRENYDGHRHHLIVVATEDTALPGVETAPWPDRLDAMPAPWLDVSVVLMGSAAEGSVHGKPYLKELARQAEGRYVQVGTDVLGWEQQLLPRIAAFSAKAIYGIGTELSFNPSLIGAFRPLHNQGDWAETAIGSGDRWPRLSRLERGENRTGLYLLQPRKGGRPDSVVECRVRFDAGDAKFVAEERRQLQPNEIHADFFTAPAALQIPAVTAELAGILLEAPSPDRVGRIAKLKQVWNRLSPSLSEDRTSTKELGSLIAALW